MTAARKSPSSSANNAASKASEGRRKIRILLAVMLPVFAVILGLLPELDQQLGWIAFFFILGAIIGIIGQIYWIRVLLKEAEFYARFYNYGPERTHKKMDKRFLVPHTKNLLPFYVFGFLVFVILVFLIGAFDLDFSYSIPFVLGALEGLPIGYMVAERRIFGGNTEPV